MTEQNLQTQWASLLLTSLADAGVRDVVISPGSRSTPLVVAAVREPRLRRTEVIDERAAAFYALGQARISGVPSVLVCTSGTAAAHYLPAIIEAGIMGTPLIVLSGDRPHELYDCRAPQTIDQVKLFGEHVRHFFDLVPDPSGASLRAVRRIAVQSVLTSTWPRPGAVHVNARWRKPLEPMDATTDGERALVERARVIAAEPITVVRPPRHTPAPEAITAALAVVQGAERGIIVAGPSALSSRSARDAIWELAAATGFAVAGEATSQLRWAPKRDGVEVIDGLDLLLRSKAFRARVPFDVAIQIGAPLTSGPWEQIAPSLSRIVLAESGWPDPYGNPRVIVLGEIAASCAALATASAPGRAHAHARATSPFHLDLHAANEAAWKATETELHDPAAALVEAHGVRALVAKAPEGSLLVASNSLAVRLVDIYVRATDRDIGVLSQRGASGIDGLVAGAAGAAAAAERPLALLIGDVTLLHDLTSLALAARVKTPLVIFVLHNGGGRIFEQLPIVSVPGIEREIVEHATTPHDIDFAPAAALYGVRFTRVTTAAELGPALDAAYTHAGCTLVEMRVAPSGAIATSRRVTAAVEAAVAAVFAKTGGPT